MKKTIYSSENEAIRRWLIKRRNEKKLTQRDVGKLLKVPHSWVGKVEQGERKLDVIEYVRLCDVLGIDAKEGISIIYGMLSKKNQQ